MRAYRSTNLSKKGPQALEELKHIEDIVIRNAEKRGKVIILDVKDYIKECERQLNNAEHYRHLEHDPTTVNKVITRLKNDKLIALTSQID